MAKIAKEKVWRTHKDELVEDGHADAAQLVARRGETVDPEILARFKNSDKFFVDHDSTEGEKAARPQDETRKPWSNAEIQAYRNAREGDEPTATTIHRVASTKETKAPADKVRKSRPGPEKAVKKASKKAEK